MPEENLGDPIPRDEPFVVPASPKETFDSIWLRNINISVPATAQSGSTEGNIHIECLPYDPDDEKIYTTPDNAGVEYLNVPNRTNGRKNFWECVNEVPEVKDAMDAIIAAIPALRTWINTPPPPPDPPQG
jgi:hypothetical protein|tara:strand:+ start:403 stop:792 length:390 start_codon:yes stop_codon:yes gene_type:complete